MLMLQNQDQSQFPSIIVMVHSLTIMYLLIDMFSGKFSKKIHTIHYLNHHLLECNIAVKVSKAV